MFYSPLRYPGGKGKLAPFMEYMIERTGITEATYIEPFAGGAGVALDLLLGGHVETIVINDYDRAVAAFWKAILFETDRFLNMLYNTPVTIDEWRRQKKIYESQTSRYSFELGFATFFLNRTNRSGIVKGGVIGGLTQQGEWKLDARFNKVELAKRITNISNYKDHIIVYNKDVLSLIKNYLPKYGPNSFVYFDPPYFKQGKALYKNYFNLNDHVDIQKHITQSVKCNWIITYDNVSEITEIYKGYKMKKFNINYSAANKRIASELMIFKNEGLCPTDDELIKRKINISLLNI